MLEYYLDIHSKELKLMVIQRRAKTSTKTGTKTSTKVSTKTSTNKVVQNKDEQEVQDIQDKEVQDEQDIQDKEIQDEQDILHLNKGKKIQINFKADPELFQKLKTLASKDSRSLSSLLIKIIKDYLETH